MLKTCQRMSNVSKNVKIVRKCKTWQQVSNKSCQIYHEVLKMYQRMLGVSTNIKNVSNKSRSVKKMS